MLYHTHKGEGVKSDSKLPFAWVSNCACLNMLTENRGL
jgi:hypothetical protein